MRNVVKSLLCVYFALVSSVSADEALIESIKKGDVATVNQMIQSGANVDKKENGATPLMWASKGGMLKS